LQLFGFKLNYRNLDENAQLINIPILKSSFRMQKNAGAKTGLVYALGSNIKTKP